MHKQLKGESRTHRNIPPEMHLLQIDSLAQQSGLGQVHAGIKMTAAVGGLILCLAAGSYLSLAIIGISMMGLTILGGGINIRLYVRLMMIPLTFVLLSGITIMVELTAVREGLLMIPVGSGYLVITAASLMRAGFVSVRAYASVTCLYMLSLTTPVSEVIYICNRIKLPGVITELMYLIYRYLTILLEVQQQMAASARSRLGYTSYRNTLRSMLGIGTNLFLFSLRKASASYDAMVSRGYDGKLLFWQEPKQAGRREILAAAGFLLVMSGICIAERILLC